MSNGSLKVRVFVIGPVFTKMVWEGKARKVKGVANVRLPDGTIRLAELHWYEAHSIGKKEIKIKLPFLD